LFLPTLDVIFLPVKIKIVGWNKPSRVQRRSRAKRVHAVRSYDMRIRRDHGNGLWTIESDSGQLYLAVLSRESSTAVSQLEERRAADGTAFRRR
jgi:hypothetical protein